MGGEERGVSGDFISHRRENTPEDPTDIPFAATPWRKRELQSLELCAATLWRKRELQRLWCCRPMEEERDCSTGSVYRARLLSSVVGSVKIFSDFSDVLVYNLPPSTATDLRNLIGRYWGREDRICSSSSYQPISFYLLLLQ